MNSQQTECQDQRVRGALYEAAGKAHEVDAGAVVEVGDLQASWSGGRMAEKLVLKAWRAV